MCDQNPSLCQECMESDGLCPDHVLTCDSEENKEPFINAICALRENQNHGQFQFNTYCDEGINLTSSDETVSNFYQVTALH